MRGWKLFGLMVVATMACAPARAANAEDDALNAVYGRLSQARAASDAPGMAASFAPGALLVDARPGPAITGAELEARLRPMAARIVAEGVHIETGYRIERRSVMGDIAVDAGYLRQAMTRPGGAAQLRYARFLVTMRRDAAGWRIVGDASMSASEEAWNGATRQAGLHFDG